MPGTTCLKTLVLTVYELPLSNFLRQTHVAVCHHAAYRYEQNFTRAEDFVPERWLPNAPPEFTNDQRAVVQPFSVGPRGCLGKKWVLPTILMPIQNLM